MKAVAKYQTMVLEKSPWMYDPDAQGTASILAGGGMTLVDQSPSLQMYPVL